MHEENYRSRYINITCIINNTSSIAVHCIMHSAALINARVASRCVYLATVVYSRRKFLELELELLDRVCMVSILSALCEAPQSRY